MLGPTGSYQCLVPVHAVPSSAIVCVNVQHHIVEMLLTPDIDSSKLNGPVCLMKYSYKLSIWHHRRVHALLKSGPVFDAQHIQPRKRVLKGLIRTSGTSCFSQ